MLTLAINLTLAIALNSNNKAAIKKLTSLKTKKKAAFIAKKVLKKIKHSF